MPSVAKKLVVVQSNEPAPQATPIESTRPEELRLLEALLFAAGQPLDEAMLARRLPNGVNVKAALAQLKDEYATRGVNLVRVGKKWTFRTAIDLSWLLTKQIVETRKLSRAAIETLAIVAYHQPVTRAEIEEIRGVVDGDGHPRCPSQNRVDSSARPAQGARATDHIRHDGSIPLAFRARGSRRPAGPRRTQGRGPAGGQFASRFRRAASLGRLDTARRRGSARSGRSRSGPGAAGVAFRKVNARDLR